MPRRSDTHKAALILSGFALTEGLWLILNLFANPGRFLRYVGLVGAKPEPIGWILAFAVFIGFTVFACRLPSVRAYLFRASWLKLLALVMAVAAGFCEETIFRKLLMDTIEHRGYSLPVQVLASAVTFGAVHGIWGGFRGSIVAAIGATTATGALGLALAFVYLASHRLLAPCVISHFFINAFAEPGLVLAAVRGEMRRPVKP